ncbi:hypothetical protein [Lutibacter sp.]|uniref:hypothetical protein n=1 Tax=Lutibacter sp. TaxID=1925666 RepID=UPI0027353AE9|nr:hypothetical protein [Lutibacter sp.]MDP3311880.1 hypothetical protein [Lutibacter sp.]
MKKSIVIILLAFCITSHTSMKHATQKAMLIYLTAYNTSGQIRYFTEPFLIEIYHDNPDYRIVEKKVKDFKEKVKNDYSDEAPQPSIVYGENDDQTKVKYENDKEYERLNGRNVKVFKL